ncbi:MAG: M48 family metallopeptidase [Fluviicola sp.]
MESIEYGTQKIHFHLLYADRSTLGIEVHPDLSVWAKAPLKSTIQDVKEKILKRASWIIKQQHYFEQFLPRTPERVYVSGETHLYLGRRYILRLREGTSDEVKLKGSELIIYYTKCGSTRHFKNLLTGWYFNHATRKFDAQVESVLELFKSYNIDKPVVEVRRMKNRWGSCTTKGKIILNPELIKMPIGCVNYVIIHEMCHLIHPNHGKNFYHLQEKLNPEWRKWKEKLELMAV